MPPTLLAEELREPPSAAVTVLVSIAVTGAVFWLSLGQPFGLADEGMYYFVARAWARGVDISQFGHRGPYLAGQYILAGALMQLLGEALWVYRLGKALLAGALAAVLLRSLARQVPLALTLVAVGTVALLESGSATSLAAVTVFACTLSVARSSPPSRAALAAAAALAGVLAGVREDSAVLALALTLVALAGRRRSVELVTTVIPAALAGFMPWVLVSAVRGELDGFLAQTLRRFLALTSRVTAPYRFEWTFDLGAVLDSPRLFLTHAVPLLAALPPLFYAVTLLQQHRRWREGQAVSATMVAAACCGLAYVPQYLWDRMDLYHLRQHFPLFIAVVALSAARWTRPWRRTAAAALLATGCLGVVSLVAQHRLDGAQAYPCCDGRAIGASLEGGAPPWAGLAHAPGDTLVVLGFGPGWYVVEGLPAGTRQLMPCTFYLQEPEVVGELVEDLSAPTNRWVIREESFSQPHEIFLALRAHYRPVGRWREWALWERRH